MSQHDQEDQGSLAPGARAHLGVALRRLFNETAREPIPEQLTALLDRLEQSERACAAAPSPRNAGAAEARR